MEVKTVKVNRETKETGISMELCLYGEGKSEIDTGVGFFNHMLESFARHSFMDLTCKVKGDLTVDCHHTIEDTGIVLGTAIREALGTKEGIKRFGNCILPMDDALALTAIDLSGRPYLSFDCEFKVEKVGELDTEMIREFFYAVCVNSGMNLHIKMLSGINCHHMIEAIFKSFAKSLAMACETDSRIKSTLSTKGSL